MNNQQKDIFISYCRRDIEKVKRIKQEIEAETQAQCWMDLEGIESGNPKFTKMIIRAINSCPIFLFMLSEASQQSENALKELDFAYKKHREEGKKVAIVYIEPCKMNDEFSFDYGKADTIDWQNSLQKEKLIRDLKKWTNYAERMASKKQEEDEKIKQVQEKINALEKEGALLYAQQKRVFDEIVTQNKIIGKSEQTCPVCQESTDISNTFCPQCGWAYIPFQSAKMDEKRLVVAKKVWEQKISMPKAPKTAEEEELPSCIKELISNMIEVEGGSFQMGGTKEQGEDAFSDEMPVHKVTLSTFAIGRYPVTQDEWEAIMG
ncbi:MAG: TIR domain-containing protein, partial [Bacteroidaceae bacterium]|nr:TIR domain-containing protein [Bacteroidaceae bacterium]